MMFRESVFVIHLLMCLSVCVSLHMVRDAYHRPLTEFQTIQRDLVATIDSTQNAAAKRISNADHSHMRATRNPLSNTFKYNGFYPSPSLSSTSLSNELSSPDRSSSSSSSLSSKSPKSSKSSSSSQLSSTLPLSMSLRSFGSPLIRSSTTNTNDQYRWEKKVKITTYG